MKNFKMIISYDGTRYLGWEHQPGTDMTIQGKLESVLTRMTDAAPDRKITVIGAGRTDAGVHARAMTANVLLDTAMSEEEIQRYLNRYLPDDISVSEVKQCADRFHSRFKATGKTYRYTTDAMREAAQRLAGMHDYKSFCGNSHMKKSTVRVIDTINIEESGNYIRIYFHGNGFLQNMVRILTGTLLEAGYHRLRPEDMDRILEAKDRKKAGPTAPACGLTMMKVDY